MIDHWSRIGRLLIRTALLSVLTVIEVLLTLLILLLTVTLVPEIILWLPQKMGYVTQ